MHGSDELWVACEDNALRPLIAALYALKWASRAVWVDLLSRSYIDATRPWPPVRASCSPPRSSGTRCVVEVGKTVPPCLYALAAARIEMSKNE